MPRTVVIGAGLVGSLLSMFLARKGYHVEVFERMPDPRTNDLYSGRSINLTLCERGLRVLDSIGVGDAVRRVSVPVYGRLIHDVKGHLTFQPYGNNQEAIYSIARGDLNRVLLDFAERNFEIEFLFQQKCMDVDFAAPTVEMQDLVSGQVKRCAAEMLFGADGAYSAVRMQMQKKARFNLSQQYWEQGYKELRVPPTNDGWTAEKNAIHIWPRGDFMLIGFPNVDDSFTCSLHIPFEGPLSFASITTEEDLLRLFHDSFPDVVSLMDGLVDDFFLHPANTMITIKCSPWSQRGKVALIGDAAHSIFPSYGQGANAGFEDCAVLAACMEAYGDDWPTILPEFEQRRRPNTDAIADLCVEHFTELRDLVGDARFLLRKEIERKLNQACPDKYQDLYSMITFTSIPYSEALKLDRSQRVIVDRLLTIDRVEQKLESAEIDGLISSLLAEK